MLFLFVFGCFLLLIRIMRLGAVWLQGFCDTEMNKKLLKKNNGSIKGVVMDLLSGERA